MTTISTPREMTPMRLHAVLVTIVLSLICISPVLCADDLSVDKPAAKSDEAKTAAKLITVEADGTPVVEVLQSIAKQSEQKIVIESTVKGAVKTSMKDQPLETALGVICKSGKFQWRKLYIKENSKLLEQPDTLAATIRLMSGLSLPDVIVSESDNKCRVYCTDKKSIDSIQEKLTTGINLKLIYLITNDLAVAEKAISKDKEKSTAVDEYMDIARESMDMFMKMTPEERERALIESIALTQNMDPQYMSNVMQVMMNVDPDRLRAMAEMQTQMLFNLTTEQRRKMLKMNMQFANMITPEQKQMLMEDSMAVMEELAREQGQPQP